MKIVPAVIAAVVVGAFIDRAGPRIVSSGMATLTFGAIVFGATTPRKPPFR